MQAREWPEEISVRRRDERHAGITQHHGEHRCERGPENEQRDDFRGSRSIDSLNEGRDDRR